MKITNLLKILVFTLCLPLLLASCKNSDGKFKLPGGDARRFPADPKERVAQNLAEGRGFKLSEFGNTRGGVFEFASSNELWRASLDVIDFMPLSSVNYSGGIIITDWYSDGNSSNDSIKISIRFLTNEIRSDALDVKIFTRTCLENLMNCKIMETEKVLVNELKKQILKKAATYAQLKKDENFKPYTNKGLGIE